MAETVLHLPAAMHKVSKSLLDLQAASGAECKKQSHGWESHKGCGRQKWGSQEICNANKHRKYNGMQNLRVDVKEQTSSCFQEQSVGGGC